MWGALRPGWQELVQLQPHPAEWLQAHPMHVPVQSELQRRSASPTVVQAALHTSQLAQSLQGTTQSCSLMAMR